MRYTKKYFPLFEVQGNTNALKNNFRTFCRLMTSYPLTKYGGKNYFSELLIFMSNLDRIRNQSFRNDSFNILR